MRKFIPITLFLAQLLLCGGDALFAHETQDDRDTLDLYERNRRNVRRERREYQYENYNRQRGGRHYYPPGQYDQGYERNRGGGNRRVNWPNNRPPGEFSPYFWQRS